MDAFEGVEWGQAWAQVLRLGKRGTGWRGSKRWSTNSTVLGYHSFITSYLMVDSFGPDKKGKYYHATTEGFCQGQIL
jgi:hypothetical protein